MAHRLKILYISAEVAPFAKTGGLADVCGTLPKALSLLGHDVRVMTPAHRLVETSYHADNKYKLTARPYGFLVHTGAGVFPAGAYQGRIPGSEVPVYFIAERNLFDTPNIYGYWDDPYRFAFFSKAVFELLLALDWRPDIVHAHDWHAAPAVTWLATAGQSGGWFQGIPSVFTIHNLAHQGQTHWEIFDYLGLITHPIYEEEFGEVNFMARGIHHATMVNTVSPSYAQEIMNPENGFGLDTLLRYRSSDVHGILNGIDYEVWDPANDDRLVAQYDANNLEGKALNKAALQERAGLPKRENVPLVAMVSRLDAQKGLDITGHVLHLLMNNVAGGEAQFVVLGTGVPEYEDMFSSLADYHKQKMAAFLTYDAELAQLIYGGSDIFLMPSLFEPCGLGQMIAMRYGTVPVVRATGGLADTVQDGITGFRFDSFNSDAFWNALHRALQIYYNDGNLWGEIQRNGMQADFSWENSAKNYQNLYEGALARI